MKERTLKMVRDFFAEHEKLKGIKDDILKACNIIQNTYQQGGKLLICGNGGSCADADHMVGELMKGFLLRRPLNEYLKEEFIKYLGTTGKKLAEKLQRSLPAISLNAHVSLNTAFLNDVDAELIFAQQVLGYAKPEDTFIGISTSGKSKNVYYAFIAAKVKKIKSIALTGKDGGILPLVADCSIIAPANETHVIQEYHLAIYHFICAFIESEIFEQ